MLIGNTIMAKVKLISLKMTDLSYMSTEIVNWGRIAHEGTAGEMFDGPGGPLGSLSM